MKVPTRWLYFTGTLSIILLTARVNTHIPYDRSQTRLEYRNKTGFEEGLEALGVKCTWSQTHEAFGLEGYDDCHSATKGIDI